MRRPNRGIIIIGILALVQVLGCGGAKGPDASAGPNADCGANAPFCYEGLTEKLDAHIDSKGEHWGENYVFSGCVVVAKDGESIYSRCSGYADREKQIPIDPDTSFRIGSVSKQFTAVAILQLQEQGKLKVTDTIDKHLPDYPKENAEKITIHHLLTHTSGTPSYTDRPEPLKLFFAKLSVEELLALFWDQPLLFEPGSEFRYSNSGYVVLGAIIESASGMRYGDYVKKYLFDKAELTRTGFGDVTGLDNRALGYRLADILTIVKEQPISMSAPYAAGGIRSTANDLIKWDQALRNGSVLSPESIDQMYTPDKENYAYGWGISERDGHTAIHHEGGITGFRTDYNRYPKDGVAIVVWSNLDNLKVSEFGYVAALHLRGEPFPLQEEIPIGAFVATEAKKLEGGYLMTEESRNRAGMALMPHYQIDSMTRARLRVADNFLKVDFRDYQGIRLQPGTTPHRYFHQQSRQIIEFQFEEGKDRATRAQLHTYGIVLDYERDDTVLAHFEQKDRAAEAQRRPKMGPFDDSMTFIYTKNLERSAAFYEKTLELPLVLEQANCKVFQVSENGYLGVCTRDKKPKPDGIIVTFVTDDVDGWADKLKAKGVEFEKEPALNPKYNIYHCFFRDPDGYLLEIQRFEDKNWSTPIKN